MANFTPSDQTTPQLDLEQKPPQLNREQKDEGAPSADAPISAWSSGAISRIMTLRKGRRGNGRPDPSALEEKTPGRAGQEERGRPPVFDEPMDMPPEAYGEPLRREPRQEPQEEGVTWAKYMALKERQRHDLIRSYIMDYVPDGRGDPSAGAELSLVHSHLLSIEGKIAEELVYSAHSHHPINLVLPFLIAHKAREFAATQKPTRKSITDWLKEKVFRQKPDPQVSWFSEECIEEEEEKPKGWSVKDSIQSIMRKIEGMLPSGAKTPLKTFRESLASVLERVKEWLSEQVWARVESAYRAYGMSLLLASLGTMVMYFLWPYLKEAFSGIAGWALDIVPILFEIIVDSFYGLAAFGSKLKGEVISRMRAVMDTIRGIKEDRKSVV